MTRKLKIGYVLDDTLESPDGVQQYVRTLSQYMVEHGHDVRFLVGETGAISDAIDPLVYSLSKNIKVSFNKNSMSMPLPGKRRDIRNALIDEKFDVLHVQIPYSPFMGGRVISMASPKTAVVGTFHIIGDSWVESFGTKLLGLIQKRTIKRFDRIGTTSEATREFVKQNFTDNTQEIYSCMTDAQRFKGGTRLQQYDDGKINILFLGRLVERKGVSHLVEAISHLSDDDRAKIRVIICGKGQLQAKLQELVALRGLGDIVEFVGFVAEEDKADYYASADISVFPATGGESFGIVLIEAMASGSAVVLGGNNPGYSTVLDKNDSLFDPHDHRAFATLLSHYINDPAARKKKIAWQNERIDTFSIATVGEFMLEQYLELVQSKQP